MADHYLPRRARRLWKIILLAAVIALIIIAIVSSSVEKWLWMQQLNYVGIFWKILYVNWALFAVAFAFAFLFVYINLRLASKNAASGVSAWKTRSDYGFEIQLSSAGTRMLVVAAALGLALIFGLVFYPQWDAWLRFRYGGAFGVSDPLYGIDNGFYVFRLPFYELVQNSLSGLSLITFLMVLVAYVYFGLFQFRRGGKLEAQRSPAGHLSILLAIVIASWAWGFMLDHYELVYSTVGVVYGAGYTAAHITRISLWIMLVASILLCVRLILNSFFPRRRALVLSGGAYAVLYLLSLAVVPPLVQKFRVEPNELELESPYLADNIENTRKAFGLDQIHETPYPALSDLTPEAIARNEDTVQNIRLWDWRPLLQTYRQTQEIRLYYQFYDVDVDRYRLSDGYHQVMLSARELSQELPQQANTWVNKFLQFTHGYGIVMSFVSKNIGGGFPQYLIENIPPDSSYGLSVDRPAIYYGERMPGYRMVATGIREFDYPKGNQNVYTSYQGKGGIPLDSFWKRILFAWTRSDINILLTSYLGPQSRIQIWRDVKERVGQIAPFLHLDHDPYAVLSGGRLYWIQDAYTTSDHYPYSSPYTNPLFEGEFNYIRNSVKAVVDMYDGTVSLYVMDPDDPVLAVYRHAFPGAFRNLDELPADLKQHLRYPEDLFSVQASQYEQFHMTVPQVFYNREDLWVSPQERYAGSTVPMEPYYILMKLPGTGKLEYLLMQPFTPQNRDNMIAWMAARCDFPEYGKILVYQLPKEKLIYGPIQIEAMIDQNPLISQQLSLWDQRGSRVIRGNLIVIPIENSFLYVEPVYLTAEGANIPQLKRVIVVSGNKVVMEPTLDESLRAVFGAPQIEEQPVASKVQEPQELEKARAQLEEAEKAMQQGDWDKFGKAMSALKNLLEGSGR